MAEGWKGEGGEEEGMRGVEEWKSEGDGRKGIVAA